MNEEELKAVWQNEEKISLENIDFEAIKQKGLKSQQKLRRRMRWESVVGILIYSYAISVVIQMPNSLLVIPIMLPIFIWYYWEVSRIYNLESSPENFDSLREVLNRKRSFLKGYIYRTRLFYFALPFFYSLFFIVFGSIEEIFNNLSQFLTLLIFLEILAIVFVEINLWLVYLSPLAEIENLLRQLDEKQ